MRLEDPLLVSETSAGPGTNRGEWLPYGPAGDEPVPERRVAKLASCSEEPGRTPGPRLPPGPRLLANGRKGLSRPHTDRVALPRCYGDRQPTRRPRGLAPKDKRES